MRPGRDTDPSPPSSAEVKNRIELYLYSPFVTYERVKPTYIHSLTTSAFSAVHFVETGVSYISHE